MKIVRRSTLVFLAAAAMQLTTAAAAAKGDRDSGRHHRRSDSALACMEFLAGDAMNGRGSGTRDEWITATYIAAQLRRSGLQPLGDDGGYVQTVEINRTVSAAAPVLRIGPGTPIQREQVYVMRLSAAAYQGPLQKYAAGTVVQPGAALLMPADAVPDNIPQTQAAGLLIWHETPQARSHWSDLLLRSINVGRVKIVGLAEPFGMPRLPPRRKSCSRPMPTRQSRSWRKGRPRP